MPSQRYLNALRRMMAFSDKEWGELIQLNGVSIPANVSELKREETLEQGGFVLSYGLRIVINNTHPVVPLMGQIVTYNGNPYRVLNVESDLVSWTLTCDSTNK